MSSSRRSLLRRAGSVGALALTAALVAACGFQPLYGSSSTRAGVSEKLAQVEITNIPNRYGQQLRNNLIDRFYRDGRPVASPYRLEVGLSATEQKLALRKDSTAERAQLVVVAPYRLIEAATGRALFTGSSRALISYNILEEQYASVVTVDNAYDRALVQIADDITNRVAMSLNNSGS